MAARNLTPVSKPIDARVALPGSKSLTNRALLMAALADGPSQLTNVLLADDTERMIAVLKTLGVRIDCDIDRKRAVVHGVNGNWPESNVELHCGDAGTVARFVTAIAAASVGTYTIDGSPRMRQRPMAPLLATLRQLGTPIESLDVEDHLPIRIHARRLRGGEIALSAAESSQFLSALLIAAPLAADDLLIEVNGGLASRPYVAMTLGLMTDFAISIIQDELRRFIVPAPQGYEPRDLDMEPDASTAGYFWAAAAVTGGRMVIPGIGGESVQGDAQFPDVLADMGCRVEQSARVTTVIGPEIGKLCGIDVDLNDMPDAAPTLAVLAAFANGPTRIRGVTNLRVKESDRLAALADGLSRLGVSTELHEDGLTIVPTASPHGAAIDSHNDHRIAMSFALAGLRIPGVSIVNAACVSKTFPGFFEAWDGLSGDSNH